MREAVFWVKWGLTLFEVIACITGFIYWSKLKHTHWRLFPIYLAVIVMVELAGQFFGSIDQKELVTHIYRFFGIPVQFLFFYWLIGQNLKETKHKHWSVIAAIVYLLALMIDLIFIGGLDKHFLPFSYTIGNIALLVLIMLFFIKFMTGERILNFDRDMMFWTALGILIFYLGSLPFYGLYNSFKNLRDLLSIYWFVQMFLNYCMYACFTIGFICSNLK